MIKKTMKPEQNAQGVQWCVVVLRNAAIRTKRRAARWSRELPNLNQDNGQGGELIDGIGSQISSQEFAESELKLLLATLPQSQRVVITSLFLLDKTQTQVAKQLGISQQQVSRLKEQALRQLRKEAVEWIIRG